jgi:hypothetical protein
MEHDHFERKETAVSIMLASSERTVLITHHSSLINHLVESKPASEQGLAYR